MNLPQVLFFILVFVKSTKQESLLMASLGNVFPLGEQLKKLTTDSSDVSLSSQEESALNSIIPGAQVFATELYSFISKQGGSVIVSPLSLQMALALALAGAEGTTATELKTLLSLADIDSKTALSGHKSLIRVAQDPLLNLANRIFVDKSAPVKEDFQKIAEEYFFSAVESLDFKGAPEDSREHINSWVERETNDKIKDLLAAGSITGVTRLVLVNAIHFKANWKTKFDESKTKDQPFYLSKTEKKEVQMMNSESKFHFLHDNDLGAKFLRLPYEGEKFEMILILPDESDGISALEPKLKNSNIIFERAGKTKSTTVDVYLPKFNMENTIDLKKVLNDMGVSSMFSDTADFSGITDEKVTVSEVVQKVFIEVNEEGTEAAAATAVIVERSLSINVDEPLVETFEADHPFLFLLVLKSYQIPVLFGRYDGPE